MTKNFTLVIGNKNYSSWSLRPWILLKYFDIPFKEILIPLYEGSYKEQILKYSPQGKVPVLIHGKLVIGESLAICQYLSDLFVKKKMWPAQLSDRALAYWISQEMHAGFSNLRTYMPMNLRGHYPAEGMRPEVDADIKRIFQIWESCRRRFHAKGPFLFGHFTVADAMFLPVVTRLRTYGVDVKGLSKAYVKTMLDLPAFKEWEKAGEAEPWVIKRSEIYNPKYKAQDQ